MTYQEVISEVRDVYNNTFQETTYKKWLDELEAEISVYKGEEPKEINIEDEVRLQLPFSKMYTYFLLMKVALHQHDDESYARYSSVYFTQLTEWQKHYIRTTPGKKRVYKNWMEEENYEKVSPI